MTVRLKDIATHAGLSLPTVSHVLGQHADRYPASTQQRVLEAARELGYRPNSSARAMRSGRFDCVALLQPTVSHKGFLPYDLLSGIYDGLAQHNLHLTLTKVGDEHLPDDFAPKISREWMVDGLLINYTQQIPPEMSEMIERNHVPAVWINSQRAKNCVYSDDYSAACTATEYLLQMGHRRIVYGTHPNSVHYSVVERQNGYADTMRKARLEPRILQAQRKYWISAEQWLLLAQRWTKQKHRPTAIMTYGDDAALAARYALQQAGLRVPQDVSIVTFSERIVDEAYWPMTTCRVPEYEIGRHSVEMLLERIQNPQVNLPARKLPFTFHPENSSAPPQATKTSATKKGKYP